MKNEDKVYEDIRNLIEEFTGRKMLTPKDFDHLALRIFDRTHTQLSVSTLKRFWGYVAKNDEKRGNIRVSTLNILAQYVGYQDWSSFTNRDSIAENNDSSQMFIDNKVLYANTLFVGDTLCVLWKPNRRIVIRYSGNGIFTIIESENSKLSVGDTFKCPLFVENLPLVLTDLIHASAPPCGYICGKNGGIKFNEIKN